MLLNETSRLKEKYLENDLSLKEKEQQLKLFEADLMQQKEQLQSEKEKHDKDVSGLSSEQMGLLAKLERLKKNEEEIEKCASAL